MRIYFSNWIFNIESDAQKIVILHEKGNRITDYHELAYKYLRDAFNKSSTSISCDSNLYLHDFRKENHVFMEKDIDSAVLLCLDEEPSEEVLSILKEDINKRLVVFYSDEYFTNNIMSLSDFDYDILVIKKVQTYSSGGSQNIATILSADKVFDISKQGNNFLKVRNDIYFLLKKKHNISSVVDLMKWVNLYLCNASFERGYKRFKKDMEDSDFLLKLTYLLEVAQLKCKYTADSFLINKFRDAINNGAKYEDVDYLLRSLRCVYEGKSSKLEYTKSCNVVFTSIGGKYIAFKLDTNIDMIILNTIDSNEGLYELQLILEDFSSDKPSVLLINKNTMEITTNVADGNIITGDSIKDIRKKLVLS